SAPAGEQVAGGENEEAARTPGSGNAVEPAPGSDRTGAQEKQAGDQTGHGVTTGATTEKKSQSTAPDQGPQQQPPAATRVASGEAAVAQPKVFLSKTRHVRTTMIKVEVDNLAYAKEVVAALATNAGADKPREVWVYQQEEAILRVVLPTGSAAQFLEKVALVGKKLDLEKDTADITAEFDRKLLEYQELAGKSDGQSQAYARALEQQLEDLDRETLEAGKEVVNVWLKLR
ncbi:MAG: hypothetical protein ACPL5F_13150, partial [Moorellaceae bacterium]